MEIGKHTKKRFHPLILLGFTCTGDILDCMGDSLVGALFSEPSLRT